MWEESLELFINLFILYGIYLLPSLIYLNYKNAQERSREDDSTVHFYTFLSSPIIAFAINLARYGQNGTVSELLDLKSLGAVLIIFLIVITLCKIKKK